MSTIQVLMSLHIIAAAFIIGFAIRRASICAVLAAEQWVLHRRSSRMQAFMTAACWSGVMVLTLAWSFPGWAAVSPGYPITGAALIGGALFGIGAYLNGACAFGTLAHLAGGDTDFAGTVLGIVLGAMLISWISLDTGSPSPSSLAKPSAMGGFFMAALLGIALRFTWIHYKTRLRKPREALVFRPWRPATAMVMIGLAGGFLHAMASEWTYMSVLSNRASSLVDPTFPNPTTCAIVGFSALLIGGFVAAVVRGEFRIAPLKP
ncbi:MAG: YeeE/YedE thiosulfate transporter family protein, partial [Pseudomonadota bacterium]